LVSSRNIDFAFGVHKQLINSQNQFLRLDVKADNHISWQLRFESSLKGLFSYNERLQGNAQEPTSCGFFTSSSNFFFLGRAREDLALARVSVRESKI
jgi:hypothetical protein